MSEPIAGGADPLTAGGDDWNISSHVTVAFEIEKEGVHDNVYFDVSDPTFIALVETMWLKHINGG